jgi:hypothetical protein
MHQKDRGRKRNTDLDAIYVTNTTKIESLSQMFFVILRNFAGQEKITGYLLISDISKVENVVLVTL